MMYKLGQFVILLCVIHLIVCPPVTEKPAEEEKTDKPTATDEEANLGLEYERYLKEVVSVLESDEVFRKKLEESNISEIKINRLLYEKYLREVFNSLMMDPEFARVVLAAGLNFSRQSGEIAKHLDFVGKGIRSRLDEIKRKEIDRLRQMMRLKGYLQNGTENGDLLTDGDRGEGMRAVHPDIVLPSVDKERILAHLDHSNPNSFEIEDLAKLIRQATTDLEDIDKKRRDEFKNYEMEKEHLRRQQMEQLDEEKRLQVQKEFEEMQQKHKEHPKVNHPGNEAQLKEVWEETDGLSKQDFDAKTFFHLHDTNSDGILDMAEIEALFQKELDKVYDPKAPEDDMMERYEEMNRMREHVMNEVDKNKDKLISLDEFLESTKNEEFKKDEEWDTLEDQKLYSEEELMQFEKEYEKTQKKHDEPSEDGEPSHKQPSQDDNLRFQPDDINRQPVRQPVQQPPHQQPQEHHQPPHQQIPEHHPPQEPQADLQQNDVEVMRQEEHHPGSAKSDEPAPPEHPASVEQPAQPADETQQQQKEQPADHEENVVHQT